MVYCNTALRDAIRNSNYTVEELAREIGVVKFSIYNWQSLRAWPKPKIARKLARALVSSVSDIFPKVYKILHSGMVQERAYARDACIPLNSRAVKRMERDGTLATSEKDLLEKEEFYEMINEFLYELPFTERAVIGLRYDIGGGNTRTHEQVGEMLGVSHETVRKKEDLAMRRLKALISHERSDLLLYLDSA